MVERLEQILNLAFGKRMDKRGCGIEHKHRNAENREAHDMPSGPLETSEYDQYNEAGNAQQRPQAMRNGVRYLFFLRIHMSIRHYFTPFPSITGNKSSFT